MNDQASRSPLLASDECSLVERIKTGETDLFGKLVQPHLRSLRVICRSILVNPTDMEEVVQETLLKAFVRLHQLHNQKSFRTWLLHIGRNEALTRNRKERKYGYCFSVAEDEHDEQDSENTAILEIADKRELPLQTFERQEFRITMALGVNSLPKKDRQILFLHDVQDLTIIKVTKLLGISIAAATSRLHRARLRLRQYLMKMGASKETKSFEQSPRVESYDFREPNSSSSGKQLKVVSRSYTACGS
jgi:RNA polymerase sigma-70 factor (ECF subfamily)